MKKILPLLSFLLVSVISAAQMDGADEAKAKPSRCGCAFGAYFSIGVLEGEKGSDLQLQTVQGIRFGKWFTGIGIGLDYYQTRGIPLFLDIRWELLNRRHTPYLYADAGIHFPWARNKDKSTTGESKFKNGAWYDVGLGYRFSAGKDGGFTVSAGFSYKYVKEIRLTPFCTWNNCQLDNRELFRYKLNRLSLRFGWTI